MKKQSNLSRLMGYAGGHRILTYLSWVLSVMSALLALVPFWYIWRIIHDILEVSPNFSQAGNVTSYGWSAVLFAVMAKPNATREEIAHALEAAQCLDIIEKLPNGIDTVVGTKGVYLSGGEQQRIAIARAILKNAPILILDEATAFADPDNEVRVQQALSALSKGKTVIMIAHRLSSITDADCIYVLQDGEIVESGTHSGLIERNGIFTKMWKNYSEAAEWKILNENKGLEVNA